MTKALLSLLLIFSVLCFSFGQKSGNGKPSESKNDTTYFVVVRVERGAYIATMIDTLQGIIGELGASKSVDQANLLKEMGRRQIMRINAGITKLDTVVTKSLK